ncbi:MAG: hypothetical protein WBE13_14165 [Candidatus Acidiferrum sp.]
MFPRGIPARLSAALWTLLPSAFILFFLAFSFYGCKSSAHTSDTRLEKIDKMLNAQLPPGTPRPIVQHFLSSRGYRIERSPDKTAVVAVIRHIDTETLQPVTARATFHFDSNEKLLTYQLQYAPDAPFQP